MYPESFDDANDESIPNHFAATGMADEIPGLNEWIDDCERARGAMDDAQHQERETQDANPLSIDPADCERYGGVFWCPRCSTDKVCCGTRPDPEDHTRRVCSGGCDVNGFHHEGGTEPAPAIVPALPLRLEKLVVECERSDAAILDGSVHVDCGDGHTHGTVVARFKARGWREISRLRGDYLTVARGFYRATIIERAGGGVSVDFGSSQGEQLLPILKDSVAYERAKREAAESALAPDESLALQVLNSIDGLAHRPVVRAGVRRDFNAYTVPGVATVEAWPHRPMQSARGIARRILRDGAAYLPVIRLFDVPGILTHAKAA
jgi:hypothetical protein